MLFNSYEFVFAFLPATFIIFVLLWRFLPEWRGAFIALASIVFYCWTDTRYLWLLVCSILFNYGMGYAIAHAGDARKRKALMIAAVAGDLLALGYFKYTGFFLENFRALGLPIGTWEVVLPLGISFYTFTQIAFIVDVYQGKASEYRFRNYALFVTYFPHLIAGPILHHRSMMPQFESPSIFRPNSTKIAIGALFFLIGMAKKVMLADTFSDYADPVFSLLAHGGRPDFAISWIGALSYSLQLYFDFSGYCDMAIGISLLFGVTLPFNFNSPYKARSIVDFWRRWHMTLSAFLRDYLYIALGGNRGGSLKRYRNLLLTMLLGGLWHGANWTFVIWGGLHGFYLIVNHGWRALGKKVELPALGPAGTALSVAFTFLMVTIAWMFFRAESVEAAVRMIAGMIGLHGIVPDWNGLAHALSLVLERDEAPLIPIATLAIGMIIVWFMPNTQELAEQGEKALRKLRWTWMGAAAVLTSLVLAVHASRGVSPFIYFNF